MFVFATVFLNRNVYLIQQHRKTLLKLSVFAFSTVFLTIILHLTQQYTGTVPKLKTSTFVTMCLTRISEASIFVMYPWPIVVRQKAACTSLGNVGRSFTYWASPETDRIKLSAVCALDHQDLLKTHDIRVTKKVLIYIPSILYEPQVKSFINWELFTCNSSCDETVAALLAFQSRDQFEGGISFLRWT